MKLLTALTVAACLTLTPIVEASATGLPSTAQIKSYAKKYVKANGGLRQWTCYNKVIYYESRWKHNAVNGSHYGLGQMRGKAARHRGKPMLQVRDAWKYMVHRYDDRACGAWKHIERVGWY